LYDVRLSSDSGFLCSPRCSRSTSTPLRFIYHGECGARPRRAFGASPSMHFLSYAVQAPLRLDSLKTSWRSHMAGDEFPQVTCESPIPLVLTRFSSMVLLFPRSPVPFSGTIQIARPTDHARKTGHLSVLTPVPPPSGVSPAARTVCQGHSYTFSTPRVSLLLAL